jgi:hypothetical protein
MKKLNSDEEIQNMEEEIKIYVLYNDKDSRLEFESKGHRMDVYVKIANKIYGVYISSFDNHIENLKRNYKEKGFYRIYANMVLVNKLVNVEIKEAVHKLYYEKNDYGEKNKFFNQIKPLDVDKIEDVKIIGLPNPSFYEI